MARIEDVADCSLRTADVARFVKALERRAPRVFKTHSLTLDLCTPLVIARKGTQTHLRILTRAFVDEPTAAEETVQAAAAESRSAAAVLSNVEIETWQPGVDAFAS